MVWAFFKGVEGVLNDNTKREIVLWLSGLKTNGNIQRWPDTFTKLVDRVFGTNHLSLNSFVRCSVASLVLAFVFFVATAPWRAIMTDLVLWPLAGTVIVGNIVPDYIALLETRLLLRFMAKGKTPAYLACLLAINAIAILYFIIAATFSLLLLLSYRDPAISRSFIVDRMVDQLTFHNGGVLHLIKVNFQFGVDRPYFLLPAFFTSIWLWLYAGAGFLLKFARRFDIGFGWFNRKFDIEKKPLQSIGLVAGALVAVVYWAAAIVRRIVG
jgi:hypothetical protein